MSHSTCQHTSYLLDCEEYDRLVDRAQGVCEICRVAGGDTKHGFLVIDHDSAVGRWAVRGLLCHNCNTKLPRGAKPAWADLYLDNPWWFMEWQARGVGLESLDEPPRGTRVRLPSGRELVRGSRGWEHDSNYRGAPRSWEKLMYEFGPHRVAIVSSALNMGLLTHDEAYAERPVSGEETSG
ncbi:endonuclease domain-containing protein [Streptomyces europaeiscabiei]|uniref:endonuclease domain-containing protein n=1 Tax=Streptomyces europaeiscabiei TaxID=146819 RepID=UPI0029B43480|nr:endonuclease domain-containing protein [Streptomyces europaeiscabiei]MDX2767004.1 endonuclease domain-containing protein [Streptomyces europaeiscabiei]